MIAVAVILTLYFVFHPLVYKPDMPAAASKTSKPQNKGKKEDVLPKGGTVILSPEYSMKGKTVKLNQDPPAQQKSGE